MQVVFYVFIFILIAVLGFVLVKQVIGLITDIKKRKKIKKKLIDKQNDETKEE